MRKGTMASKANGSERRLNKVKRQKVKVTRRNRLDADVRAKQILRGAISFFAEHGFSGQTRELTNKLGVSKGLLYRYFPSKKLLIDKVYEEVFLRRWNPKWESILSDRSHSLVDRLKLFYLDYSKMLREYEWVRIYLYAGLARASINQRYVKLVVERIYRRIIDEFRNEFGYPSVEKIKPTEPELEMIWNLHGSIFYIGVRKWVYYVDVPLDIDGAIERMVDGLYVNAEDVMRGALSR